MNASSSAGRFRRAVMLSGSPGLMHGEVEDDFHHFAVDVRHDGARVTGIAHRAIRHPWSLCPAAGGQLQALVGVALDPSFAHVLGEGAIRENCTHMYDTACLAIAAAAQGVGARRYDLSVEDRVAGATHAALRRDDGLTLGWDVEGTQIAGPAPYAGISLKRGFPDWAAATLPPDEAEAAIVLRRGLFVSNGRRRDLDDVDRAIEGARNLGGCFVMREGRAEHASRMRGATRDFTDRPDDLLKRPRP